MEISKRLLLGCNLTLSCREVVIREFADQRLQLLERFLQFDVVLLLTPGRLGISKRLLLGCNLTLSSREVVIREFADQRLQLLERFLQFDVALLLTPGRLEISKRLLLGCNLTLSCREVVIRDLQISGCVQERFLQFDVASSDSSRLEISKRLLLGCNLTLSCRKLSFAVADQRLQLQTVSAIDVALLLTPGRLGDQQAPAPWLQSHFEQQRSCHSRFADQRLQLQERFLQFDVALLRLQVGDQQAPAPCCNLTLSCREVVIRGLQISGCSARAVSAI